MVATHDLAIIERLLRVQKLRRSMLANLMRNRFVGSHESCIQAGVALLHDSGREKIRMT
jgi:hypothetical protein